jgi:sugar phosphate isomerase/epimerase
MHSKHWTQDAMKRAERLVGEAADTLEGEPLGIAADYLDSVARHMQADGNSDSQEWARLMFLSAQADEYKRRRR